MDDIRVGIIGSGFMGRTHAEALASSVRGARLVAVCGGSRAQELARDFRIEAADSVSSFLRRADVDAVVVATPQSVHASQVVEAAKHHKHVLLEKPMGVTLDECRAMNRACREAGVNLMLCFTQRFRHGNMEAKRIIDEGGIGSIRMIRETMIGVNGRTAYPAWQQQPENLGTLLGYGVHSIDRIRWFTRDEVAFVMARAFSPEGSEFSSMVFLRLKHGQSASLLCDMECPAPGFSNSAFRSWIIGDKGIIDLDAYGELRVGMNGAWKVVFRQEPIDWQKDGKFSPVRMQSFRDQDQEFVDSILESRQPAISGLDGEKSVEVALAAYESSRRQCSVELSRDGATLSRS